ncbi:hypothetical protein FQA39_LY06972 [Lamprigera yunnana]|nr:hypothetical protein FQA39_LY06972 [Lamprigera yunnana]
MFLNDLRNRLQPEAIPTLINGTKLHVKKKCAEDTSATNSNKIIIIENVVLKSVTLCEESKNDLSETSFCIESKIFLPLIKLFQV